MSTSCQSSPRPCRLSKGARGPVGICRIADLTNTFNRIAFGPEYPKIFLYEKRKVCFIGASSPRHGGRIGHSSPDVRRVAMDARGRRTCGRNAYGQAVWSCPANAGDKPARRLAGDGGKKAGSPGRSRSSRKPIAQGVPDDFGVPVLACARLFCFAREAVGAACTRHSLRPPFSERRSTRSQLGCKGIARRSFVVPEPSSFICLRPWFGY
jgi:hypothetical protein